MQYTKRFCDMCGAEVPLTKTMSAMTIDGNKVYDICQTCKEGLVLEIEESQEIIRNRIKRGEQ